MPQFLAALAPAAAGAGAAGAAGLGTMGTSLAQVMSQVGAPAATGGLGIGAAGGAGGGLLGGMSAGLGAVNGGIQKAAQSEAGKFVGNVGQIGSILQGQTPPPAAPAQLLSGPVQLSQRGQQDNTALIQMLLQMLSQGQSNGR